MNTTPTLPTAIEIFRPGRHIDDAGNAHDFTPADVGGMAASYDPSQHEAPLVIGHPKDDLPAWGWVQKLMVNAAGVLAMDTHQVEPAFAEMVTAGRFKKRSASFYPPGHHKNPGATWLLRHVAFLGAQPPAIHGLKNFAAGSADGAISFSEGEPAHTHHQETYMTPEEIAALQNKLKVAEEAAAAADAATKAANDRLTNFAEQAKTERKAGFVSFAEGLVKTTQLKQADAAMAAEVLELLSGAAPVSFSEGATTIKLSPVEWLKGQLAAAKPAVQFGEFNPGTGGTNAGSAKGLSDAEIDAKAKAYAREKSVSYAEALSAVCSFTA